MRHIVILGWITTLMLCGCGGGGGSSGSKAPAPPSSGIAVDLSHTSGPTSYLYRLGLQDNGGSIAIDDFSSLGNIRVTLGWAVLGDATSLADVQARLVAAQLETVMADILARGGEVTITLEKMPRYLSSQPTDNVVDPASGWAHFNAAPPISLTGWADLVDAVVTYFSITHGLNVRYEVWNEPDSTAFWRGTRSDFFALYRASALGARRAYATATIGGPSISALEAGATSRPTIDGWMREFIAFCAATAIPEVTLARTPIDFLAWHEFLVTPPWGAFRAPQVSQWLADAGYPAATPLLIDEWNINLEGQDAADVHMPLSDTVEGAACAVANVFAFRRAGLDRHAFSAMGDWSSGPTDFHGGQGIVTQAGTRKPVYRAFQCLSQLVGNEATVVITHPSPFIDAAAAVEFTGIAVLVVSHVPDPLTVFNQAVNIPLPDSATAIELVSLSAADVQGVYLDTINPATLPISASARGILNAAQQSARDARVWRGSSANVPLTVRGVTAPFTHERRYAIDSTHSNALSAYTAAITAGASETTAITTAQAADSLSLIGERDVLPGTTTVSLQVESSSVWLVTYTDGTEPPLSVAVKTHPRAHTLSAK